jgi:glyoxalase superfamily protein
MTTIIPVFRVFDYAKTIEFYIEWLGFTINWEHKQENSPFYMQVSLRGLAIELSEHHGDCSPGGKLSFRDFDGLQEYHRLLTEKGYKFMRPGLERVEWQPDTLEMTVIDPFSNRLLFTERIIE